MYSRGLERRLDQISFPETHLSRGSSRNISDNLGPALDGHLNKRSLADDFDDDSRQAVARAGGRTGLAGDAKSHVLGTKTAHHLAPGREGGERLDPAAADIDNREPVMHRFDLPQDPGLDANERRDVLVARRRQNALGHTVLPKLPVDDDRHPGTQSTGLVEIMGDNDTGT